MCHERPAAHSCGALAVILLTMRWIVFAILFTFSSSAFGCCGEGDYRLLPIGEINGELFFAEFDLSRNCRMKRKPVQGMEFFVKGEVNLAVWRNDSLEIIQTVDTLDEIECQCSPENYLDSTRIESIISQKLNEVISLASRLGSMGQIRTKNIIFNDSSKTDKSETSTDTSFSIILKYDNFFSQEITTIGAVSCYPDKVAEIRSYESKTYDFKILKLRCQNISKESELRNIQRFKKLQTAYWKAKPQWHGVARDYLVIMNNR